MTGASPERVQRSLRLALRAAHARGGTPACWAFAVYADVHPDGIRHGVAWWIQTVGGERLPLSVQLLRELNAAETACWIWGQVIATLDVGPLQADTDDVVQDLVLHHLITPHGVPYTPDDYVEIRARMSAHEAMETSPIVCVVRGSRPMTWPL